MCDEPGGTYGQHWRSYVKAELLGHAMVDPTDMDLFYITDHAEQAVEEILRFYRRYHSLRYLGDHLVMRLSSPLAPRQIEEANELFADIVKGGRIEQCSGPLEGEHGSYPDKFRLVFAFDRRSTGRLRGLVNWLNGLD
jgi:hypothetical protein